MRRFLRFVCMTAVFMVLAACGSGGDTVSTASPPVAVDKLTVNSTIPRLGAVSVAPNTFISIVFSSPLQPNSVTADTIIVSDGARTVPGIVSCVGNTATFKPFSSFAENTIFTVVIKKKIKSIDGLGLTEDIIWNFTTGNLIDVTPPHIFATSPLNNSTAVSANTSLLVTFSEPVNPDTVNATTFTVRGPGGPVAGTISTTDIIAVFTPTQKFSYLTPYTITITQGVTDFAGNPLNATTVINFRTGEAPDVTPPSVVSTSPTDRATGISASTSLTITFSESVNPVTVNASTFVVTGPSGSVTGVVTTSGKIATFTPSASLEAGTVYTATAKTGIKDLAGNPLAANFSWSFTVEGSAPMTNSGQFADFVAKQTGSWPEAVAIGDVNGDGRNDVVMVTSSYSDPTNDHKLFVFLQNADGSLASPVKIDTGGDSTTVAIGDVNGDSSNEVVIGNKSGKIAVFRLDSAGGLVAKQEYATTESLKIRIADLNNDGRLDVVGIGWGTNKASIWYQKDVTDLADPLKSPVIVDVQHGGYDDLDVGDVNNDGLADIIVMSGQLYSVPNISVLTQKAGGGFNTPVTYSVGSNILAQGIAVGDVNGDGKKDIVVSYGGNRPASNIGVFLQNSAGTLDPVVNYQSYDIPEPVEIADVNGDGRKDVIVLHGGWNTMGVYLQAADGTLKVEEGYAIPYASHYNPHGLAVGDINGDGKNDVVIADYNNGLVILYHK